MKKSLFANSFRLAVGTASAQLIAFVALAITTRLYTPESFGAFGLIFSASQVIGLAAALRMEQAAILAQSEEQSRLAIRLSIILSTAICTLLAIIVALNHKNLDTMYQSNLGYAWLTSILAGYIISIQTTLTTSAVRNGLYTQISISRSAKALTTAIIQIGFGLALTVSEFGLIIGEIIGVAIASVVLFSFVRTKTRLESLATFAYPARKRQFAALLKKYRDLPLVNLPQTIINNLTGLAAISILIANFSSSEVGQFFVMQRLVSLPASLIATSIAQVYLMEATRAKRDSGQFDKLFLKASLLPAAVGIIMGALLYFWGQEIFNVLLGNQWRQAGQLSSIYAPYVAVHIVLSTLAPTALAANKQRSMLAIGIIQNGIYLGALYFGVMMYPSIEEAVALIVIMSTPYMLFMYYLYWRWSRSDNNARAI